MSRVLLHHLCPPLLVQLLLGTPLCAAHFQHNLGILQCVRTCPKCSVSSTLFSHVCRFPTHPLLDCWFLLRAPCCRVPRTANTQIQELQIPSIITFKTSHTACFYCTCWCQQQKFIGAVKLADKNSSHPSHYQIGPIFGMVSSQADLSGCPCHG